MKREIKTRCFSCLCFCGYPKKHSKLSISTRRGRKISKSHSRTQAGSRTESEWSSCDESFSCDDIQRPEHRYQIADDREEKHYSMSELDREVSEIAIPSSSNSEISSEKSYTDGIPANRDSEISGKSYIDERPKHRGPQTGHTSYRIKIPMCMRGGEIKCRKCSRDVIPTNRDSEISPKSYIDERPRHGKSKTSYTLSKIVVADEKAGKQNMMSEHDGVAYEISLHESDSVEIPRSRDSETSSQESYSVEIPRSRYSETSGQKSYRDEISVIRDSETSIQKSTRDEIATGRDSETSGHKSCRDENPRIRYCETSSQQSCGDEISTSKDSETSSQTSCGDEISNSRDFDTSSQESCTDEIPISRCSVISSQNSCTIETSTSRDSESSNQESCTDKIPTSRELEISYKSYRDEKPRRRESKTNHNISKIVVADDKVVKQYTISEHDGEESEISMHESYNVETPRSMDFEASSQKSYREGTPSRIESEINRYEKSRHTECKPTHRSNKIVVADAKHVKHYATSEHDGVAFEIPRSRDSETNSHNSCRDGIPTSIDAEISHKFYKYEKPRHTVSKSNHKISKNFVADDKESTSLFSVQKLRTIDSKASCWKNCKNEIPSNIDFEISHKGHRDGKLRHRKSKTSHKINKIVIADDNVVKQYTTTGHDGEASEISLNESYSVEIPRSRDSETSSEKIYGYGIPISKDSEISDKIYRDEKLRRLEPKTSHKISEIIVADDKEVKQCTMSEHVIPTSIDAEISNKIFEYEKPRHTVSKSNHKISKIVVADDKESISLHWIQKPKTINSEASSWKSCTDEIPSSIDSSIDSEISHKGHRYGQLMHRKSKTSHKINKIVVADDNVVKQYTTSGHDGEAYEISLNESYSVEIPRSRDSETSSEKSYGDGITTNSEKSYGDGIPTSRDKISEILVADDKEVRQCTMSEHDGEASETSLQDSVEIPTIVSESSSCRYGIPTSRYSKINHKTYRDEKLRHTQPKTSDKINKNIVANDKEVKQYTMNECDGEASEISLHENCSVEISRSIDSVTSNLRSCRDGIPTCRDSEFRHRSYIDEKPRQRESKTNQKISEIVLADDKEVKQYTLSEHDEKASEISLRESYSLETPRRINSGSSRQNSCRDVIPTGRDFIISHKSYRDEKPRHIVSKTNHKISKIVANDREIKQYIMSKQDGEASEISMHESYSVEKPKSRDSETSSQHSSGHGIPISRDSEISHKIYRDEKSRHTQSKTSHKIKKIVVVDDKADDEISLHESYNVEIPRSRDSETSSQNSCRDAIHTCRDSEINERSYIDEKPKHKDSKTSHKCSKIIVADDKEVKQYTMSKQFGEASEISLQKSCSVELPRSRISETSSQKKCIVGIPTSRDLIHKSYRDEKPKIRGSNIRHNIGKSDVANDKELEQDTISEQDGEASEISLHESYSVDMPKSIDYETSSQNSVEIPRSIDSETSSRYSCRDAIHTCRDSEINERSYIDEKPKNKESKTSHEFSKIVVADDKEVKQYTMSKQFGEASEISLHKSCSVELPRSRISETSSQKKCINGIPTSRYSEMIHKSFRDEKPKIRESNTSHMSKIVVANDKDVEQYTEISLHESSSLDMPRGIDSETSSQNSCRDQILTSRDSGISYKSYRVEKPKYKESKTTHKSYKIKIPMLNKASKTSRQKSSCRYGKPIHRSSEKRQNKLSICRCAETSRRKCKDEIPQSDRTEIIQASYGDEYGFEIRQQCRDKIISIYGDSPYTNDEFEDHVDKSFNLEPFYESEDHAEIIRQLVRQFFAEGGLHAAEILAIDDGDSISLIGDTKSVHKLLLTDEDGTNCHYCTVIKNHGRGRTREVHGRHDQS